MNAPLSFPSRAFPRLAVNNPAPVKPAPSLAYREITPEMRAKAERIRALAVSIGRSFSGPSNVTTEASAELAANDLRDLADEANALDRELRR